MSSRALNQDAAGGVSWTEQEADAAAREYQRQIDLRMHAIHVRLRAKAQALLELLDPGIGRGLARSLILDALYDMLRMGAYEAMSGAIAEAIAKTERK